MDVFRQAASGSDKGLVLPRPFRSGLALAAIGVLPLALGLTAVIRPLSGFVLAGIFLVGGVVQASVRYHELVGLRRLADEQLRRERRRELRSTLAHWRAGELTSDRNRKILARSIRGLKHDLSPGVLPGASPLDRIGTRPHVDLLAQLADRLAGLARPVSPLGVLQVEELLTSPDSPLYAHEHALQIRPALRQCLELLDDNAEMSQPISDRSDDANSPDCNGVAMNGRRR